MAAVTGLRENTLIWHFVLPETSLCSEQYGRPALDKGWPLRARSYIHEQPQSIKCNTRKKGTGNKAVNKKLHQKHDNSRVLDSTYAY
jgi:hypothetical protein